MPLPNQPISKLSNAILRKNTSSKNQISIVKTPTINHRNPGNKFSVSSVYESGASEFEDLLIIQKWHF